MKSFYLVLATTLALVACNSDNPPLDDQSSHEVSSYHVDLDEAIEHVKPFFPSSDTRGENIKISEVNILKLSEITRSNEDLPPFYVVNFDNEKGFAILASDRRIEPIYAISDSGSLELSDTIKNQGLAMYINSIMPSIVRSELDSFNTDSLTFQPGTPFPYDPTPNVTYTCRSLIPTPIKKWAQWKPYNKYCPIFNGENSYAGCLPTAMAQIMAYFKWPTNYPVEYSNYTLNWDILNQEAMTDDKINSVSRLLEILGRKENLNAQYSPNGTTAKTSNINHTLQRFSYKPTSQENFSISIVIKSLKKNIPIMVYGNGTIASNNKQFAHQFIIDGHCAKNYVSVNRSDYFHCVWGWGGRNNGYFLYKTDRNALGGKPNFVEKDETMPDKEDWEANIQLLLYPGMEPQR